MSISDSDFQRKKTVLKTKLDLFIDDYEEFIKLVSPQQYRTTGTHCTNLREINKDIDRFQLITPKESKQWEKWEKENLQKTKLLKENSSQIKKLEEKFTSLLIPDNPKIIKNPNDLKRIEGLLKTKFLIQENSYSQNLGKDQFHQFARVVLVKNNLILDSRTHNLQLIDNRIWWENNNSQEWFYEFESWADSLIWWKKHVNNVIVYGTKNKYDKNKN
jgi:hypothetical protein